MAGDASTHPAPPSPEARDEKARARGAALVAPLDPEQREAVLATHGRLVVVGPAGSGKTRVLAHRIAYLCAALGVPPRRLLALSQTERDAEELRLRAQRLVAEKLRGAWFGPFSAVCQRILRAHASAIGRKSSFRVLSPTEARILIRRAAEEIGAPLGGPALARAQEQISAVKNLAASPDTVGELYRAYEQALARHNALDPDDVLLWAIRLLDENSTLRDRYRRRFEHILVDRFEDTTRPQRELLKLLVSPTTSLLVCLDDDESLLPEPPDAQAFAAEMGGARVVALRHAYRSSRRILYCAGRLIAHNAGRIPKEILPERRKGARVVVLGFGDELEEAACVVRAIQRLVARGETLLSRTAIIFRQDLQARPFEEALARAGIPYRVVEGLRFYARREIRDVMCYLRLCVGGGDPAALARIANVPRRGIGPASVRTIARLKATYRIGMAEAALRAAQLPRVTAQRAGALADLGRMLQDLDEAARTRTAAEMIDFVLSRTGYDAMLRDLATEEEERRREGIDELRGLARAFAGPAAETLPRLFERAAQAGVVPWAVPEAGQDGEKERRGRAQASGPLSGVQLLTIPAAKGREFEVVFLTGLEEGLLPRAGAIEAGDAAVAAERRLCYIGITRARSRLFLTYALTRTFHGKRRGGTPSRFVAELGRRARRFRLGSARPGHVERRAAETPLEGESPVLRVVREGQRVVHPRYGPGVVVRVEDGTQSVVVVQFDEGGEKRLALRLARLQPA